MNKAGRLNLHRFAANFSLEEGTLFHSAKGSKIVVVHTRKQALQLFEQYHDSSQGRHQGIVKTTIAMNTNYYWPGMTKDIADWVCTGIKLNPGIFTLYFKDKVYIYIAKNSNYTFAVKVQSLPLQ
ncbi:unnamed protein product [Caretta caretta]